MIYLVDDDPYVRRGFGILFKSAKLEFLALESAGEFLKIFQPDQNSVIILDMHMPGMNGCELLHHLSEKELFIPVIVITAYDEPASRECARNYGALAYLRKPVDGEALIDLIKYAINPV